MSPSRGGNMFRRIYAVVVDKVLDEIRCCGCIITIGFAGVLASGALGVGTALVLS
jgi:hypothetical protein